MNRNTVAAIMKLVMIHLLATDVNLWHMNEQELSEPGTKTKREREGW